MNKGKFLTVKAISSLFLGILTMLIAQAFANLFYLFPFPKVVNSILFGLAYVTVSFLLIWVLCKTVFHYSLKECYIGKFKIKYKWLLIGFFLPLTVSVIFFLTPGFFIFNEKPTNEIINNIIISLFISALGAGIVEELIFRGFIMHSLKERWGKVISIFVPSFLFAILHITSGMKAIDILALLIAGTSVGIMFSLIVYQSKNIWSSVIVHSLWNFIIIGSLLNIGVKYNPNSVYSYILTSKSLLLTGGRFGIEASLIAILGYYVVIAFTLLTPTKK